MLVPCKLQMELQAPANVRLVIVHYYPQDSTLEVLESKETACPGAGRSFALRRPSRVSLDDIRVGASVLVRDDLRVWSMYCAFYRNPSFRLPATSFLTTISSASSVFGKNK